MINAPIFISACCVTLYWITVIIKSIKLAPKIGKDPNVIPRERRGQLSRVIWFPTLVAWIALLWYGALFPTPKLLLGLPSFITHLAALLVMIATVLTFWCWHEMGTSWRIGIDPKEKTRLVSTGPYRYVRHPIYGLSIVLSMATWITLPTLALLVVVLIHITLLCLEARREEQHMLRTHGSLYNDYRKSTGYFMPCTLITCQKKN